MRNKEMIDQNTSLTFLCLIFSAVSCCLNIAILLLLTKIITKEHHKETEEMLMRFLIIIGIIALMGLCNAQDEESIQVIDPYVEEEDPPIELISEGDKPVVFPEPMQEASIYIYGYFGDFNQTALDLEWAKLLNATNMTM